MRKVLSWKHFLVIPVILFLAILPAWLVGRPLDSLLSIYWRQAQQPSPLTQHAASLYAWIPVSDDPSAMFVRAGIFLGAVIAGIFIMFIWKSKVQLTRELLVATASLGVLLVPFVLPEMHERYFFQADLLSIAFGFYFPSYFYVPVIVNMASFFSYWPFLFGVEPLFPMGGLGLALLIVIMLMVRKLLMDLYPAGAGLAEIGLGGRHDPI